MEVLSILHGASHPVIVADEKDRVLDLNKAAEELLETGRAEVVGRALHEVTEFRDVFGNRLCSASCSLHEMVRRGEPIQAFELDVRRGSGTYVRLGLSVVVILGQESGSYRMVYHLILRRLRFQHEEALAAHGETTAVRSNGHDPTAPQLTRRERQILARLVAGERSREISDSLGIRPNTLRSHTQNILRKLQARSKVEAVSLALRQNLL